MKSQKNARLSKMLPKLALSALCLTLVMASTSRPVTAQVPTGGSLSNSIGYPSDDPFMLDPMSTSLDPFGDSQMLVPLVGHPGDPYITGGSLRYANDGTVTVTSPYNSQGYTYWIPVKSWKISVPVGAQANPRVNLTATSAANMSWLVEITTPSGYVYDWSTGYYTTNWGLVQAGPLNSSFIATGNTITLYFRAYSPVTTQMSNTTFEVYW